MNVFTIVALVASQIVFLIVFVMLFTQVVSPTIKEAQESLDTIKNFAQKTVEETQTYIDGKINETNGLIIQVKQAAQKC